MKKKARIIFSDGSKEMAHNLDDLYERWMLKRTDEWHRLGGDLSPFFAIDEFAPTLPYSNDYGVVQERLFLIRGKIAYIEMKISETKLQGSIGEMSQQQFNLVRSALVCAKQRLVAQSVISNNILKLLAPNRVINNPAENKRRNNIAEYKSRRINLPSVADDPISNLSVLELKHDIKSGEFSQAQANIDQTLINGDKDKTIEKQRKYIDNLVADRGNHFKVLSEAYEVIIDLQKQIIDLQEQIIRVDEGT